MDQEPLLTTGELAALFKVPAKTPVQWRLWGKGPKYIKVGRHIRYRPVDVERWLESQAAHAGSEQE